MWVRFYSTAGNSKFYSKWLMTKTFTIEWTSRAVGQPKDLGHRWSVVTPACWSFMLLHSAGLRVGVMTGLFPPGHKLTILDSSRRCIHLCLINSRDIEEKVCFLGYFFKEGCFTQNFSSKPFCTTHWPEWHRLPIPSSVFKRRMGWLFR